MRTLAFTTIGLIATYLFFPKALAYWIGIGLWLGSH
jgi:hypothetical protein